MRELDLFTDLPDGVTLIEAAAGTGKTYAIVALYLRLVLERELPVESILVVTFTEAATEELRDRVRQLLSLALDALSGRETEDRFIAELVRRLPDTERAGQLLTLALASFDGAAIHTIHGFCARVLQENAFECGALFDTELLADQGPIIRELADDFWRRHFYPADELFVAHALRNGLTVDSLATELRRVVGRSGLSVIPQQEPVDTEDARAACCDLFRRAAGEWTAAAGEVTALLMESPALSRTAYRLASVPAWVAGLERYFAGSDPLDIPDKLEKFTPAVLAAGCKKGQTPPVHPFFACCEELVSEVGRLAAIYDRNLLALRAGLLRSAREELRERKARRNLRSYDDLLSSLHEAVVAGGGARGLAERVRSRYRAVLVDEFQDTDPLQYAIFAGLFGDGGVPLLFIGDPKQAIYSFRGADLHAYLAAARRVAAENGFTLLRNWRSSSGLLDAVNALFGGAHPFLLPEIGYRRVTPGSESQQQHLFPAAPPFVLWNYGCAGDGHPAKSVAEQMIASDVAAEVARLIRLGESGEAMLADRPLHAGDIAVLVRKNYQGRLVQQALQRVGVPSVLHGTESLFSSAEALELWRVLSAIAGPANEPRLRGALATDLLGWTAAMLAVEDEDSTAWAGLLERIRGYHDTWALQGVMAMATELLAGEGVRPRLLAHADGERRLTNILHLLELLHHAELEGELGLEGLVAWLAERVAEQPEIDEYQLRLETDESCVQLVTVHRSKGLEYPVVFCPFAWEGVRDEGTALFHDNDRMVLDLGSGQLDDHRLRAREERFAEDLRLLYVAVTRAKERCYLIWGGFRGAEESALAWLLFRPAPAGDEPLSGQGSIVDSATEQETLLLRLAAAAGGAIALCEPPAGAVQLPAARPEAGPPMAAREFHGVIDRSWRVTSFTGLVSGKPHAMELPDRDAAAPGSDRPAERPAPAFGDIFSFPRGAVPGTCLHAVLERVDFAAFDQAAVRQLAREQLARHGLAAEWEATVARMIGQVVRAPLAADRPELRLERLGRGGWQPELEFMLPLAALESGDLARVFRSHGAGGRFPDLLDELGFGRVRGMLRGFIDLVFCLDGRYFLIDWKSNHLGNMPADYAPERLDEAMEREYYTLQYHLYCVALHRWLESRMAGYDYDRHFGGVLYLFLRGVDVAVPGQGVFHARPERGLVEALSACLTDRTEVGHGG
ncbi:MAG: exodeoxyribonuclease V subunit beta [Geobacter sp.]|nr:exodeoxyribonuclease V subunit beta [Geobacter sp.]